MSVCIICFFRYQGLFKVVICGILVDFSIDNLLISICLKSNSHKICSTNALQKSIGHCLIFDCRIVLLFSFCRIFCCIFYCGGGCLFLLCCLISQNFSGIKSFLLLFKNCGIALFCFCQNDLLFCQCSRSIRDLFRKCNLNSRILIGQICS